LEIQRVNTFHRPSRAIAAALAGSAVLFASAAVSASTMPPSDDTMGADDMAPSATMADMSGLSGEIIVSGSSTVEPIAAAVATAFSALAPSVAISVDGPGTGDGFARFCAGETDVSNASRPISAEEVESCTASGIEFIELPVAIDGLSVITSAENTAVECLSFVDMWALLGPDATGVNNWADASATADEVAATVTDLGAVNTPFPDAPLTVTAPGEESGTFDSFVEIVIESVGEELGVEDALPRLDYTASPNDNVIIDGIAQNPTSLGWVGYAFVEENLDVIKPLSVDGGAGCVEPTPETIASGEYPIARTLYIYVNAAKAAENPALAGYVDFFVGEGMTTLIGAEDGQVPYVVLSDEAVAATQAVWANKEVGSRDGGS
jgi:phosphate transport system substrate-binding protein